MRMELLQKTAFFIMNSKDSKGGIGKLKENEWRKRPLTMGYGSLLWNNVSITSAWNMCYNLHANSKVFLFFFWQDKPHLLSILYSCTSYFPGPTVPFKVKQIKRLCQPSHECGNTVTSLRFFNTYSSIPASRVTVGIYIMSERALGLNWWYKCKKILFGHDSMCLNVLSQNSFITVI